MPTLPGMPASAAGTEPSRAREIAESFGVDAQRYDRARPRYPVALLNRILAASPGRQLLDVGCGTGIASRQFQALGCAVLGVDPDPLMADFAALTGVQVEVATFETWDPTDRLFDAVVAGQAWHWVDPVAGPAKAARVLRPDGLLAVFGNVFDAPPVVAKALAVAYREVAPDAPFAATQSGRSALDVYQEMFAAAATGIRESGRFDEPARWRADWEQTYTRDQWLDLLPTTGGLTRFPPAKLSQVLDRVGAAIDAIGGGFTMTFTTLATVARLGDVPATN